MLLSALRAAPLRCGALPRFTPLKSSATRSIFSLANRSRIVHTSRALAVKPQCSQTRTPSNALRVLGQSRFISFTKSSSRPATGATADSTPLPILAPPAVGGWLMASATLVLAIIVVGGVTRLTESGLSITEWKPITGVVPPLTHDDWMVEFNKYKETPEFKLLNHSINLDDFKSIFFWEWSHRVLGRLIGVAFVGPLAYFALRKKISRSMTTRLFGLSLLIGAQGALGWYMVKSGLDNSHMEIPGSVPRVSQYRLAAHLGMAFLLYLGMFGSGMAVLKDWKYANGAPWSGATHNISGILQNPLVKRIKAFSWALTGLVFLTAMSGAFVAGLDAGLLYNEFPLMGGRLAPPSNELFDPAYAKAEDKSDLWWRSLLENPTTVQFDHRVLATTTYFGIAALYVQSLRPAVRAALPPLANTAIRAAFTMANIQVLLGISTLLYLVPIPLAAAHQAGSVMLLSAMAHVLITLRRPGAAARLWRAAKAAGKQQ
ncbi:hypothetical protein D9611_002249 [Ephemerocybe angulata]|uniref:Uncharacterized protein n=1 Tax=Ephemerocybe angulata TaxID=980116 RepID=A0A8H5C1H5_9AGAR|nr:hypothetical protein D9611_002249 [Tulosesus angulatus]